MDSTEIVEKQCPYCGEVIEVIIDCSVSGQSYIEDCQVCCRPILINVTIENETVNVSFRHENEA